MAEAMSLEELRLAERKAQEVRRRYLEGLENADVEGAGHTPQGKQIELLS